MNWQPIETAPTDRVHIRGLWVHNNRSEKTWFAQFIGLINEESGDFVDVDHGQDFGWDAADFTHWSELLPPPTPNREV